MTLDENPFCPTCGLRTFPQWGEHECKSGVKADADELRRIRHAAGDILTNLHFYRIPPDMQIAAIAEALAFTLATNVHPRIIEKKWAQLKEGITNLMQVQLLRQAKGTNAENIVMDVNKPRMKAKVKHVPVREVPSKKLPMSTSKSRKV